MIMSVVIVVALVVAWFALALAIGLAVGRATQLRDKVEAPRAVSHERLSKVRLIG
jgi:hypothetical protein